MFCYIHIPFCESKCRYCRFASVGNLQEKRIDRYIGGLLAEIKISKTSPLTPLLKGEGDLLKSIYFGGGTPSVLKLDKLELILNSLKDKFGFKKQPSPLTPLPIRGEGDSIEITLESTPGNITKQNLIGWKKLGINRLSIGVQTLNEKSLNEIGRGTKGDIINALECIQTSPQPSPQGEGVATDFVISLDFIIGLPFVKTGEVKKDIAFLLDNYDFIQHISVYMLEEYYSPDRILETKYDNITYPKNWKNLGIKEEEYLGEYVEIKEFLESRGFAKYEISNFARSGFECKHNKAYWNHDEVIAFGLGASGFVEQIRYTNSDSFKGYYAGEKTLDKLEKEDIFLEKVMFGLRTTGVGKDIYKKLDKDRIGYFLENGFLRHENDKLVLEDKGVLILDYILREII